MKYTAFPVCESIGVAGCELETLNGFLNGLRYLGQIRSLKPPFMQDLLTGKKRVNPLLNDTVAIST